MGEIGEWSPMNTYEEYMDRAKRGRIRVGGGEGQTGRELWVENGDNCT